LPPLWLPPNNVAIIYDAIIKGGESESKKVGIVRKREEFEMAAPGAAGPEGSKRAFIKARTGDLSLKEKVGKIQVCCAHWIVLIFFLG